MSSIAVAPMGAGPALPLSPCSAHDEPELWFAERPADIHVAKQMCMACPFRVQCLEQAQERREPWGIWGGEVFVNGVVVAHKRGRGRPRKSVTVPVDVPAQPAVAVACSA